MQLELAKRLKDATGASDETVAQIMTVVSGFLKEKLPASIAPHVGVFFGEQGGTASVGDSIQDAIGDKLGGLGGMFGGD